MRCPKTWRPRNQSCPSPPFLSKPNKRPTVGYSSPEPSLYMHLNARSPWDMGSSARMDSHHLCWIRHYPWTYSCRSARHYECVQLLVFARLRNPLLPQLLYMSAKTAVRLHLDSMRGPSTAPDSYMIAVKQRYWRGGSLVTTGMGTLYERYHIPGRN